MLIPRSRSQITPEWLTSALHSGGHLEGGAVEDIRFEDVAEGTGFSGEVVRLKVLLTDTTPLLPDSMIAKFSRAGEELGPRLHGIYGREMRIYQDLRDGLGVPLPEVFYGDWNPDTGVFFLLMEDLDGWRGGRQSAACSVGDARLAVENAARLHAHWWNRNGLGAIEWLNQPTRADIAPLRQRTYQNFWERGAPLAKTFLSPAVYEIGSRLGAHLADLLIQSASGPCTINHGDYRMANLFFRSETAVAIDWQITYVGPPAGDVAYFLSTSVPVQERRECEQALLDVYLETLIEGGVTGYTKNHLFLDYRFGLLRMLQTYAFVLANTEDASESSRARIERLSERLIALQDWDCGALIPS